MKRLFLRLGIFLGIALFVVVILPLIVPLPPLFDVQPAAALADADSQFLDVNGLDVHYKRFGSGEPAIILLHGFSASTFSWREVVEPLAEIGTVIVYDRPGFGLTERPLPGEWQGAGPYGAQANVELLFGLMDRLGIQKAVLAGHSAGGRIAVEAALTNPERVQALVLLDPAVYQSGGSRFGIFTPFIDSPQMDRLGPFFARSLAGEQGSQFLRAAWADPARLTPEIEAGYRLPLQVENWDVALWEYTKAAAADADLAPRLGEVNRPTLIVSGAADAIVPLDLTRRLAAAIPAARLELFPACGHLPQEECPAALLQVLQPFLAELKP